MSRMHASGLGTIGAAFLYFDALKRQAILKFLFKHVLNLHHGK